MAAQPRGGGGASKGRATSDPHGLGGGGRRGSTGSGDQRHRNRQAEINRVAKATGTSAAPVGNTGVSKAGRVASVAQGMNRDYQNTGNSFLDNVGNLLAGQIGFNEQRPSLSSALGRVNGAAPGTVTDNRAGWGFDPAGLMGSALGAGLGVPFLGNIADWASSMAGRPMEIGMGPSVFGGGPSYGGSPSFQGGYGGQQMAQGGTGQGGQQWAQGGVLAPPQPATPSIPGASNNAWGPPPQTPMPSLLAPQWPQPSSGLLSGQNNNWSWGSWG